MLNPDLCKQCCLDMYAETNDRRYDHFCFLGVSDKLGFINIQQHTIQWSLLDKQEYQLGWLHGDIYFCCKDSPAIGTVTSQSSPPANCTYLLQQLGGLDAAAEL